jgi:hypothetical protein
VVRMDSPTTPWNQLERFPPVRVNNGSLLTGSSLFAIDRLSAIELGLSGSSHLIVNLIDKLLLVARFLSCVHAVFLVAVYGSQSANGAWAVRLTEIS